MGEGSLRSAHSRRWRQQSLFVLLGILGLLWPALLNGGPFWFQDTTTYIRAADAAVVAATGRQSAWSDRLVRVDSRAGVGNASTRVSKAHGHPEAARGKIFPTRPVITGRSIYYGFLLYFPMAAFGPWGAILVQAALVSALLVVCLGIAARQFGTSSRLIPVSLAVLSLLTPLPFYTSMLMPDVYSGVLILALATAMCFWAIMTKAERLLLVAASAILATFHTTHLLLAISMAAAAGILIFRGMQRLSPVLIAGPAIILAIIAEVTFSLAVRTQLGEPPLSPPFLSARVTASGPGTRYLHERCGKSSEPFALCRYRARLPLDSDSFLWGEGSERALFQVVNREEQRRISAEDKRFFLAVLANDPADLVRVSAASVVDLATRFDLTSFNYVDGWRGGLLGKLPRRLHEDIAGTRAFKGQMPTRYTIYATVTVTVLSLIVMAALLVTQTRRRLSGRLARYGLLIVLAVLANAVICGTLSKATGRYQMRLIWLLPAVALVLVAGQPRTFRRTEDDRDDESSVETRSRALRGA
jgi:hypothetical protein